MSLSEKYKSLGLYELVQIVENKNDYTEEAYHVATNELAFRPHIHESVKAIAKEILHGKMIELLNNFDVINDTLELPGSNYFNDDEVKKEFKEIFARWQSEKKDMTPDSWQYIIGSVF